MCSKILRAKHLLGSYCIVMAERTRFELVVGLLLRQFSKLVVSATHPPLQFHVFNRLSGFVSANLFNSFYIAKF